ncbi:Dyp-type peroxidase [Streptomyces sp. NPDC006872]|uniref:Dyp-type peroxidase n=1 Tax=Streptomyces sp. NPDC006872 TaxID=3155720 RepID=UPI0033C10877
MAKNAVFDAPTRRRVLIAGAGIGLTVTACTRDADPPQGAPGPALDGVRQAGVTTSQQATALLLAYDLDPELRGAAGARALKAVLAAWTHALAEPDSLVVPEVPEVPEANEPDESDEADEADEANEPDESGGSGEPDGPDWSDGSDGSNGSGAARFTATVGIGPRLPGRLGVPVPAALRELPPFPGERLDPARCGGDVLVQLCADSADATEAAAATLTRLAGDTLRPRWRQAGFLPPSPDGGGTPRDLLGFKNGSANPTAEECERWVWTGDATYLVVRRVHLSVEDFARLPVHRQEEIIGRRRETGGPLDGGPEHADVDIHARTAQGGGGRYVTPPHSHVRAASPTLDAGARMLRRGYSYADGPTDQGLLFLAFMRDPALFTRVQRRMAARDELSRFSEARGSAVAYVLPGARPGRPLGAELLG